jgi:hypothetical protein
LPVRGQKYISLQCPIIFRILDLSRDDPCRHAQWESSFNDDILIRSCTTDVSNPETIIIGINNELLMTLGSIIHFLHSDTSKLVYFKVVGIVAIAWGLMQKLLVQEMR